MPELPDITVYIEALESRIVSQPLERVRIAKPFLLRSVDPPISAANGKRVLGVRRMGKRIVVELEDDLFLVIHLMIAGRLRWVPTGAKVPGKVGLAAFDFPNGTLILTEAGSKRRASLWLVRGEESLEQFERGGLEVLEANLAQFTERLTRENHTLKRSLTDPRLFSGIGNAYSDEILHRARLSPVKHTRRLSEEEIKRLFDATRTTLIEWTERLRKEAADDFPAKVTTWPCTESLVSRARCAEPHFSESATPTTRPTIARGVRPRANCSQIARCRVYSSRIGRARST